VLIYEISLVAVHGDPFVFSARSRSTYVQESVQTLDLLIALAASLAVLSIVMAGAFLIAMRSGNGGWADTVWTFGVGLAALTAIAVAGGWEAGPRHWLVGGLAALWSVRLGTYLFFRTRGKREDARYADLRLQWGEDHPKRLFLFLQAQAVAALPLVGAIALAANRPGPLDVLDALGALTLLAGVAGAAVADSQMARFKADPANHGRVCDTGLWSISRHPNYFSEFVSWCAWPVIAFDPASYPVGLLAIAAPALIYYLLVHVSGVPPLEAHMERSRPKAFAEYKARVPVFFPKLSLLGQRVGDVR
jgi:steroid 5-alpha reductase family enzyme